MSGPNPAKFTWVAPTQNTDGSAITSGEITGYQIGIRPASGTPGTYTIFPPVEPPSPTSEAFSLITPALAAGTYFAAIQTLSTSNGPSAYSAEISFTLVSAPNPPSGFATA